MAGRLGGSGTETQGAGDLRARLRVLVFNFLSFRSPTHHGDSEGGVGRGGARGAVDKSSWATETQRDSDQNSDSDSEVSESESESLLAPLSLCALRGAGSIETQRGEYRDSVGRVI